MDVTDNRKICDMTVGSIKAAQLNLTTSQMVENGRNFQPTLEQFLSGLFHKHLLSETTHKSE